jgi:hypothetical protein
METTAPNIMLKVKHDTSKQGKVFGESTYAKLRQRLSDLISMPYTRRLIDVWCENKDHHAAETVIIIDAKDRTYQIEKVCCQSYRNKINEALANVEDEQP